MTRREKETAAAPAGERDAPGEGCPPELSAASPLTARETEIAAREAALAPRRASLEAAEAQLLKRQAEIVAESNAAEDAFAARKNEITAKHAETDRAIELRARDRQRKLIAKIDAALQRIDDGTYGYCEETGEPISLKRLDARPIATLSIEAQERHERRERVYRDD